MAVMLDEMSPRLRHDTSAIDVADRPTPRPGAADGSRLSVLIIDEHDVARCGLRLILASQSWVGPCMSAPDISTAVDCVLQSAPSMILYAARPALQDAQQACRTLLDASPGSVLLLMSSADRVTAQTLNSVAAYAHISKKSSAREIVKTVRLASLGLRVTHENAPATLLSTRQQEVLELLASGETNAEIAGRLYLSAHTVKQHTCAIYRKLQVRNRAEAIRRAQSLGLLV